jgi:hypothetical protein
VAIAPLAAPADANAPLSKVPQSGWYRIALGDFEVTALSDGTAPIPMEKRLTDLMSELGVRL